jgi:hypothetical protein
MAAAANKLDDPEMAIDPKNMPGDRLAANLHDRLRLEKSFLTEASTKFIGQSNSLNDQ